ncbi:phage protein Gp27 family protein [Rhodospirillum sp. A1_3_36]|uniref:phage protein Gp27 family protein n=1 Tax=Rhodospirillum sp. A1_3_36 TaxID=3391666 RepID=UPI0039A67F91
MGRPSTIRRLRPDIKDHIDAVLAADSMTLDELIGDLRERFPEDAGQGDLPSRSALGRYGQNLNRRLTAIRASTEAAKIITAGAEDSLDARSEALTAMIQTELFESIMALQEAKAEDVEQGERVELLSKAAKNIATLTRSSVNLKKFKAEAEERGRKKAEEEAHKRLASLMPEDGRDPKEMTTAELEEAIRERIRPRP